MKQSLTNYLNSILYYKGRGANNGVWETWKEKLKENEHPPHIEFSKPISQVQKISGWLRVYYFHNNEEDTNKYGHEFKVERHIPSYSEEATVFEGWVQNVEELDLILKAVGLPTDLLFLCKAEYGTLDKF